MKNLVTGGCGLIGSHLIDKLMNKGEEVICVDNLVSSELSNINQWLPNNRFKFLKQDVSIPFEIKVDKIWHLASPASPYRYQKDPISTSKIIFMGTYNMLKLANKLSIPILCSSTSEIYGNPTIDIQNENYYGSVNPVGLRSCYAEGKRLAETLCADFNRIYNLDVKIARIFNTYGPRMLQDDGRVISNFIFNSLNNLPIKVFGEGKQTRTFCYVDDLVDGLIKLMNSNYTGPINLGNPLEEISILELAYFIKNKTNSKSTISKADLNEDDPLRRKPDIDKAIKILDWYPKVKIDIGINKTIQYFRNLV